MGTKTCKGNHVDKGTAKDKVRACRDNLEEKYENVESKTGLVCNWGGQYWTCTQTFTYGDRKEEPEPEPEPEPAPAPPGQYCDETYIQSLRSSLGRKQYTGSDPSSDNFSAYLQRYNAAKGKEYELVVRFDKPLTRLVNFGTSQPPARMDSAVWSDWEAGREVQRVKCDREGGIWYWVTWPAELVEVAPPSDVPCEMPLTAELRATLNREAPETLILPMLYQFDTEAHFQAALAKYKRCGHWATPAPEPGPEPEPPEKSLRKQWDDFFKNPDVITAIGLTPSSIQESISLVFSHYSIINEREQEPEPGDYISAGLIIAGLTLAAATAIYAVMPGAAAAADLSYIEPGLTGASLSGMGVKGFLSSIKAGIARNPLLAILIIPMYDVIFWGPSVLRDPIKNLSNSATSVKITLESAIKNEDWVVAGVALTNLEELYDQMDTQLSSFQVGFFEAGGVNYADFRTLLDTGRAALAAYRTQYPQLLAADITFPKEFLLDDVDVIDGDGIRFPGHPEVKNEIRILGIDAHESETAAGQVEKAYLQSLIQGRQVRILVTQYQETADDKEKLIGIYGRLLAGVFLGDQDVALAMLEHFGKALLVASKYQKKYRWIDWDEYKRVAEAAKGPAVQEFKLYIDSVPSNAKLYVDGKYSHHLTPSDETELKDVMDMLTPGEHVIKATKAGKSASVKVDLTDGANPDIMLNLQTVGLEPVEPGEVPTEPPETVEKFVLKVLSSPTRARLYIDGEYTHHFTPSDEGELEDVMGLLTPGNHTIRAEKAGKMAEVDVDIKAGYNEPVVLTLKTVGLPTSPEELQAKIQAYRSILEQLEKELAALTGAT